MNRKILRGTAAAFAAALAVTALAPATVSEAASAKVAVVATKTASDGTVTKYTYDSRGRVIKEVSTLTAGTKADQTTGTKYAVVRGDYDGGTTTTTKIQKVNSDGTLGDVISEVDVDYHTYKADATATTIDYKKETTTTYTYYNSGAKKDKKKTVKSETVETQSVGVDSTDNEKDGGFSRIKKTEENATYTYDSKGNVVYSKDETVSMPNWYYVLTTGANYATDIVDQEATYTAYLSTGKYDEKYVDGKGTVKYTDLKDNTNYQYSCFNDPQYANAYEVSISETKNGSSESATLKHSETYMGTRGSWWKKWATDTIETSGGLETNVAKTNSLGLPLKATYTVPMTVAQASTTTEYDADGNVVDKKTAEAKSVDLEDAVVTVTYKYGKDMQLQKKVETGKSTDGAAVTAAIFTTAYGAGGKDAAQQIVTARSAVVNYVSLNTYKKTTTFDYKLKDGTFAKTSEIATSTTSYNDGTTNNVTAADATTYKLKMISVPSSRQETVMLDTYKKQTSLAPDFSFNGWKNDLVKSGSSAAEIANELTSNFSSFMN